MGHGKLRKFAENETFKCLIQPSAAAVMDKSDGGFRVLEHPIKGKWNSVSGDAAPVTASSEAPLSPSESAAAIASAGMFAKAQPIVLELGCGRGEYTIDLALRIPERNYIGVDIKGARLWQGAKYATEHNLPNVAFLRTRIELIEAFFAPGEVSEIWLTFSDPQLGSENKRLTSPVFLEKYRKFLAPGGRIHLKTDSRFLYEYTRAVAQTNNLRILAATTDLYNPQVPISPRHPETESVPSYPRHPETESVPSYPRHPETESVPTYPRHSELDSGSNRASAIPVTAPELDRETMAALTDVQTFYERMFMKQGYKINYLCFTMNHEGSFEAPADFDPVYWRSIEGSRKFLQNP